MSFEEILGYWEEVPVEWRANLQNGCWLVLVLLGGHLVGSIVARTLRTKNFDLALRLPSASGAATLHGITPTFIAGMIVRLTIWAAAAAWFANKQGRVDIASTISLVISRTWAVAALLVFVLALGSVLAQRLIDCLDGPKPVSAPPSDGYAMRNGIGTGQPHRSVAGIIGAGAYILVVLIALLMVADMFDWPLTRNSAIALWALAQKLLVIAAALAIGYIGASWAKELAASDGAVTQEKRAGQYTAVGIVSVTTILAVGMLLSNSGVLVGLAAIVGLGLALWVARGYLPDLAAGLQLRTGKVREAWFDGEPWEVAQVGVLSSHVSRAGEVHRVQNKRLLDASRHNGAHAHAEVGAR